jgi:hypothetical protein
MKPSPLLSGILHIVLACLFTYFAIGNVNEYGWDFFSILLVLLATFDFGSGIRLVILHFKISKITQKNEP